MLPQQVQDMNYLRLDVTLPDWTGDAEIETCNSRRLNFPISSIRDQAPEVVTDADRRSAEWFKTIFAKQAAEQRGFEGRTTAVTIVKMAATARCPLTLKKARVPAMTRSSIGKRKADLPSPKSNSSSPHKKRRIVAVEGPPRRSSHSKKQGTIEVVLSIEHPDPAPKSATFDKVAKTQLKKLEPPLAVARPRRNMPRRTAETTQSPSPSSMTLSVTPSSRGLSGSSTAVSPPSSDPTDTNKKRKRAGSMEKVVEVTKEGAKEPVALRRTSRVRVKVNATAALLSKPTEAEGSPRKRRKATGQP